MGKEWNFSILEFCCESLGNICKQLDLVDYCFLRILFIVLGQNLKRSRVLTKIRMYCCICVKWVGVRIWKTNYGPC